MDVTLLSLVSYLTEKPHRPVVIFGKTWVPKALTRVGGVVGAFVARGEGVENRDRAPVRSDWAQNSDWVQHVEDAVAENGGGVAVFVTNARDIPLQLVETLRALRFSELVYLEYGDWYSVKLLEKTLKPRMLLERNIESLRRAWRRVSDLAARNVRKIILKRYSTDLRHWFPHPFIRHGSCGFYAHVPQLRSAFDTVGITRDEYALFDEELCLQNHLPLAEIESVGLGACSLWETDAFFSTIDGSDPNTNGRRYRLLPLRQLGPLSSLGLRITSRLDVGGGYLQRRALDAREMAAPLHDYLLHIGMRISAPRQRNVWEEESLLSTSKGISRGGYVAGRILHYAGTLGSGGSERQLTYLATSCQANGFDLSVAVPKPQEANADAALHYRGVLESGGVSVTLLEQDDETGGCIGDTIDRELVADICAINQLPSQLRSEVGALYAHLQTVKPQVIHCWLDHANCAGGIAALLAGVPQIVLSFRSVNPTHFPHFYQEWFFPWYQKLLKSPRVSMLANSREGAMSYAAWLGIEESRISVVHNGLDMATVKVPPQIEVAQLRGSLAIPEEAPVIVGVFRFSAEKRPLRFLRIVSEVMKQVPDVHAVVAGDGPLFNQMSREISNLGLTERVHLLGRRRDIPTVISAGNMLLLTSNVEGLPNVLMEAQFLGRPVVAPRVGGIPEVVIEGQGGFLFDARDVSGAVDACINLLSDAQVRSIMAKTGGDFVRKAFTLERMCVQSLDVYRKQARDLGIPSVEPMLGMNRMEARGS